MRKVNHRWRLLVVVAALLASTVVIVMSSAPVATVLSLIVLVISAVCWQVLERRERAAEQERLLHEKDQEMMRALSHYRHDWMNDLQVLFGYVRLQKYDKLAPYLERIKSKLGEESQISNIGNASLSLLLLSYRLYNEEFELNASFAGKLNLQDIPVRAGRLVRITRDGLNIFKRASASSVSDDTNRLDLEIKPEDEYVQLSYRYAGVCDRKMIEEAVQQRWTNHARETDRVEVEVATADDQVNLIIKVLYE